MLSLLTFLVKFVSLRRLQCLEVLFLEQIWFEGSVGATHRRADIPLGSALVMAAALSFERCAIHYLPGDFFAWLNIMIWSNLLRKSFWSLSTSTFLFFTSSGEIYFVLFSASCLVDLRANYMCSFNIPKLGDSRVVEIVCYPKIPFMLPFIPQITSLYLVFIPCVFFVRIFYIP